MYNREDVMVIIVIYGDLSTIGIMNMLYSLGIRHKLILPTEEPSFMFTHIVLSGGPKHAYDGYTLPKWITDSPQPVLGICFGMQLIAHTFGGVVTRMYDKEYGLINVIEKRKGSVAKHKRWMNRYDRVVYLPSMFIITGYTEDKCIASFTDNKKWWAVQYHPEHLGEGYDPELILEFLKISGNR